MAQPTQERLIDAAEKRLGIALPQAFRRYLLTSNGGDITVLELPWRVTPVRDNSDTERAKETEVDIVLVTTQARQWDDFPKQGVTVADDGCGNYLLFLPGDGEAKELAPRLYVWWHEGGELELAGQSFDEATTQG
jgi:hypothetical protein